MKYLILFIMATIIVCCNNHSGTPSTSQDTSTPKQENNKEGDKEKPPVTTNTPDTPIPIDSGKKPPIDYGGGKAGLNDTAQENNPKKPEATVPGGKTTVVTNYHDNKGALDDTAMERPKRKITKPGN